MESLETRGPPTPVPGETATQRETRVRAEFQPEAATRCFGEKGLQGESGSEVEQQRRRGVNPDSIRLGQGAGTHEREETPP